MNKIKDYKEYIILLGVSIILLLFIIFRSTGNVNYKLPVSKAYDPDTINHITVKSANVDYDFVKTDDRWYIEPEKWEADETIPNAIAKELAELKIVDLISTSGNNEVYNLDENYRISIKAFIDNKLIREIFVGKISPSGIYTYIQLPNDKNIYSVRGNLSSKIKNKNSLRDKNFLSIDRSSISKLILTPKEGEKISLTIDDTSKEWNSDDIEVDNEAVKSVVNILDPLRCVDFREKINPGDADWILDIFTDQGASTLSLWKPDSGNNYTARYSGNGYFVSVSSYSIEKILSAFGYSFDQ